MVDLRGVFVVEQIVLTNRPDDFCLRLKKFQIDVFTTDPRQLADFPSVSGDVCYNRTAPLGNSTYTWNCTRPLIGRYVRLVMFDNDYLHVLEVEVMTSAILSAEEMTYTAMDNTRLVQGTHLGNLSAMFSAILCAGECSRLRDSLACTAFNWTPSTYECQLVRVDPRMTIPSTALEWADGVQFFLEDIQV
ncbi:unnamed protein product [Lymnaea stagnalis]|uniref:Apple domain-containing protein n=1 Tax=Lymnaea stagnalis TaxID=6523 RepID=A0AAV2IJG8_LYMST